MNQTNLDQPKMNQTNTQKILEYINIVKIKLNNKFFEIPIWVWLIITIVILYSIYYISNKKCNQPKEEIKTVNNEQFVSSTNNKEPNIVIYNFNTSWCGWSKRFQPEWDKFSEYIINNKLDNIKALDVKCDSDEKNIQLASKYNVPGYPYIIIIIDDKNPIVYNGERTSFALIEHMNKIVKSQ